MENIEPMLCPFCKSEINHGASVCAACGAEYAAWYVFPDEGARGLRKVSAFFLLLLPSIFFFALAFWPNIPLSFRVCIVSISGGIFLFWRFVMKMTDKTIVEWRRY